MGQAQDVAARPSEWWHWFIGVVALTLIVLYARAKGGKRASASFYETAAQIIPVLIVTLVVEQGVRESWETLSWAFRFQVVAALLIGEVAAVLAVALGTATEPNGEYLVYGRTRTDLLAWLSVAGLAVGFVGVVWISLLR
jgi:hypothetical protein